LNKSIKYSYILAVLLVGQLLFASCKSTQAVVAEPTKTPYKVDSNLMETVAAGEAERKMTANPYPTLSYNLPTRTLEPPMESEEYTTRMADISFSCADASKELRSVFSALSEDSQLMLEEDFVSDTNTVLDNYENFCANFHVGNPPDAWKKANEYFLQSDDEFQTFVDLFRKALTTKDPNDAQDALTHFFQGDEYWGLGNSEVEKVLNK